ncbi:MAG: TIGR01620 family protein [Rhodobacter sp.]|nr:TIGR01620 family protein [Rhodobacter sp.]
MNDKRGPVLIELDEAPEVTPSEAPPVADVAPPTTTAAMQTVAQLAARRPSRLARWFWSLLGAILAFVLSVAAWDFVTGLIARNPVLGGIATALIALFVLVLLSIAIREWAAFARLQRIDGLHRAAETALAGADLGAAQRIIGRMMRLYAGRDDLSWARDRLAERQGDVFDADGLFALAENELLAPIDRAAQAEIEAAARQVATVTAIVPLALADVAAALTANLRMIRRIAELYGGRSGTLGSWRLTRTVLTHLVATGAVAVGDDLIGSVAGGGIVSKLSRRFGEGVVNGALTARVGVAAMEVCRPLPFRARARPSVTGLVKRALTGLFTGANTGD